MGQSIEEYSNEGSKRLCNTHKELYGRDSNPKDDVEVDEKTMFILCCGPVE